MVTTRLPAAMTRGKSHTAARLSSYAGWRNGWRLTAHGARKQRQMLSRHRIPLKKPSKLSATIALAGIGIAAATSVATITWPSGAGPDATTATADFLPGVSHATGGTNPSRFAEQLQSFRSEIAWHAQLAEATQAQQAAARRAAAIAVARRAAARRAAARNAALLASQQEAQQQQAQPQAQQQTAPAPPAPVAPSGSPQQIAEAMLGSFGWSTSQFSCLDSLWGQESGWNVTAANPDGAYGIPQALPGSKMASAGPDWETDAATQIRWGLGYISDLYGSPCAAWAHEEATGWY
jgi:hypothetical protein